MSEPGPHVSDATDQRASDTKTSLNDGHGHGHSRGRRNEIQWAVTQPCNDNTDRLSRTDELAAACLCD